MLTAEQVGAQLGLSARKVYALAADGSLASFKFGRAIRFDPQAVTEYKEKCQSVVSRTLRVALASSLSSRVVSMDNESEYEKAFRQAGIKLKPISSTGKSLRSSTRRQPGSKAPTSSSKKLSLVTSENAHQS